LQWFAAGGGIMAERQKVLIIDDSPLTVRLLADILQNDYEIIKAYSGTEGIEAAWRHEPDIIILDVVMRGLDGYEVCKILKSNDITKNIPIIFITSLGDSEDERKGLEAGAIDYITKPFSEPIVKIRVKNHLELKRHRDFLSQLSAIDGLTGIYNRRYFDNEAKKLWDRAVLNQEPFSLLMFDIDHFKKYNDTYGHVMGDECLKKVAINIGEILSAEHGVAARYGGEEFSCLLYGKSFDETVNIAKKVFAQIKELNIPHSKSVYKTVTLSCGVGSVVPGKDIILEGFIHFVDSLLYKAKNEGRNRFFAADLKDNHEIINDFSKIGLVKIYES